MGDDEHGQFSGDTVMGGMDDGDAREYTGDKAYVVAAIWATRSFFGFNKTKRLGVNGEVYEKGNGSDTATTKGVYTRESDAESEATIIPENKNGLGEEQNTLWMGRVAPKLQIRQQSIRHLILHFYSESS